MRDIDAWMTVNMHKMNRDKTELVILNASRRPPPSLTSISVCDELISKTSTARNIGVLYDTVMSVKHNLTAVCKARFFNLQNISRITKYISRHTAEILVHAFINSRLAFCNSLLYGLPKKLSSSFSMFKIQLPEWLRLHPNMNIYHRYYRNCIGFLQKSA